MKTGTRPRMCFGETWDIYHCLTQEPAHLSPFCVLWFKAFVDYLSAVMRQLWLMVAGLISF